ncbi:cupredoxin domain-containing protein [Blastococcus mobilis]|uniref:Plastocyanin n=1 Tax=Blastococcus mobilis TaxID=1938746 RepID=A0A238VUZ6_9ACTN|nr:cupredoxin domain-containing protein [Blastococcus mobilis]SNR38145.1 Plastocyanin [Blastococcus mobilis]
MNGGRRTTVRRGAGALLGLLMLPGVLAGCSGEDLPESGAAPLAPGVGEVTTAPDGVQEITLQTQDDYVFTPDHFTVDPGPVRLTVVNVAEEMTHDFRFTPGTGPAAIESVIDFLAPGEEMTIDFEATAPGDYPFECSFHVQLDQVGTMTVRDR